MSESRSIWEVFCIALAIGFGLKFGFITADNFDDLLTKLSFSVFK